MNILEVDLGYHDQGIFRYYIKSIDTISAIVLNKQFISNSQHTIFSEVF